MLHLSPSFARWPYFSPVIDEVLTLPVSPEYFRYLRQRIKTRTSAQ